MAEKASADRVAADMQPPGYRQVVQLIRHSIKKKKEKIAGVNKEISGEWAKVEGFKVNKIAAKMWAIIDKLEPHDRPTVMRDLNGMIDAAGWDEEAADLVDSAQGNVVHLRAHVPGEPNEDEGDAADEALDEMNELGDEVEAAAEAPAPRKRRSARAKADGDAGVKNAADAARERLKQQIAGGQAQEPEVYQGDDSDLSAEEWDDKPVQGSADE